MLRIFLLIYLILNVGFSFAAVFQYNTSSLMPLPKKEHPPLKKENADAIKKYQEEHFAGIAKFINSLYAEGKKINGADFDSGAFIIEDKDYKIWQALKSAVATAAKQAESSSWMTKEQTNAKTLAYPRKSSHINKLYFLRGDAKKSRLSGEASSKKADYVHYGIDFASGQLKMKEGSEKSHILFGKVGKINGIDWLFIKPEEHGLGDDDFWSHALGFAKSKLGIGEKADGVYRKERIPKDILADFESTVKKLGLKSSKQTEVLKNAKAYGIWFMANFTDLKRIDELKSLGATQAKINANMKALTEIYVKIVERYPDDYCVRMGNEILLTQSEIDCNKI